MGCGGGWPELEVEASIRIGNVFFVCGYYQGKTIHRMNKMRGLMIV
jgi:hypothetical protein